MLQKSLLWSPDSQKHSFKLLNDLVFAPMGLLPFFYLVTMQGIHVKNSFRFLSRNQPYFGWLPLELEKVALAWFWSRLPHISWLSDAIIMPSPSKFRTKRKKRFHPPFGIHSESSATKTSFCRKWGISRFYRIICVSDNTQQLQLSGYLFSYDNIKSLCLGLLRCVFSIMSSNCLLQSPHQIEWASYKKNFSPPPVVCSVLSGLCLQRFCRL